MELTPRQQAAVDAATSVAVTAGAGTGKTAMLAKRYLHHVIADGFSPLEIAAVTFTEKAAAELRSRIRNELAESSNDDRAAEVDAAQISTIHSLAGRICRDFYDAAGIPADFRMLDDTDADILLADWFDKALAGIGADVVNGLGYTWLRGALRELFTDPPAAKRALDIDTSGWEKLVKETCERSLAELVESDCWQTASDVLKRFRGQPGDKLEAVRINVVKAMSDIAAGKNVAAAFGAFEGFRSNGGASGNWTLGLHDIRDCLAKLRDAFRNCQDAATLELGAADEELRRRTELLRRAFAEAFDFMQMSKLEKRLLDFADLEYYALKILESPAARDHYAERWKAILVDEFQDTNPIQEEILNALSRSGVRLTIVGDGKQSIYGFRRADPRVFARFRGAIANDVVLDKTFRTHAGLVRPLNDIFAVLLNDAHEPLEPDRETPPHQGPFIEAHTFSDEGSDIDHMRRVEAGYIAEQIRQIIENGLLVWDKSIKAHRPVRPSDIAILSRTRAPLETYIDELLAAGVPSVNTGGGDLLETTVAKDASVLLRFIADPMDDIALAALLRGPFFAVSDIELYRLSKAKKKDESWWALLSRVHIGLERPFAVLGQLRSVTKSVTAERLVEIADELTGYTAVIANLEQGERRMADWFGFLSLLRRFAKLGRSDIVGADRYLKDLKRAGSSIARPPIDAGNAVSLMTIHAAKGLEWPIVFVPNLSASKNHGSSTISFDAEMGVAFKVKVGQADGTYTKDEPAMLKLIREKRKADAKEESARILYVAMTRARDRLYLTSAGKLGNDFAALIPGLEAAGVAIQPHSSTYTAELPLAKDSSATNAPQYHDQVAPVAPQFDAIAVTGLVEYAVCPKRFKFQYIDGHPGIGEGASTDARTIGTLAHTALELGKNTVEDLMPFADGASDEVLQEAVRLARRFNEGEGFREFRLGEFRREVPVRFEVNGSTLLGSADLVGDEFVLDFKTDSDMLPDEHAIQLWAYAKALNKKRALVAYLRQQKLHEYQPEELEAAAAATANALDGIKDGLFAATPTEKGCRRCRYSRLCVECFSVE